MGVIKKFVVYIFLVMSRRQLDEATSCYRISDKGTAIYQFGDLHFKLHKVFQAIAMELEKI